MPAWSILLSAVIGFILGATVVYFLVRPQLDQKAAAVERELEERRALTEKETVEILEISRQEAQQIRLEAEKNIERRGGQYFRATDEQRLREIYEEIDRLERTRIEVEQFTSRKEEFHPFAMAGSLLLLAGFLVDRSILRGIA